MDDVPPERRDDDGTPDDGKPGQDPAAPNPFAGTPFEQMFGGLAGGDMSGLQAMFGQLQRMFAPHEGAVNWDYSRDLARQVVAQKPDRSPDAGDTARLADVARLAEHWLDGVTDLPAASSTVAAWSRAEWVEASMPVWKRLVEPIAESVAAAMGQAMPAEAAGDGRTDDRHAQPDRQCPVQPADRAGRRRAVRRRSSPAATSGSRSPRTTGRRSC